MLCVCLFSYFCSVGERVQANITGNATLEDFPPTPYPPIFDLQPVTVQNICEVINDMKSAQSCSVDGITSNLLKAAKTELSPIL